MHLFNLRLILVIISNYIIIISILTFILYQVLLQDILLIYTTIVVLNIQIVFKLTFLFLDHSRSGIIYDSIERVLQLAVEEVFFVQAVLGSLRHDYELLLIMDGMIGLPFDFVHHTG